VKKQIAFIMCAAALLAGCANNSPVGLVDVGRIIANWKEYQLNQQQLYIDEQKIVASKASNAQKQQAAIALQKKYEGITENLTDQIRKAAQQVADKRNLKLVVTKQGVGYGGVDITPDVEKVMNITETSPAPSPQ
jgi:Skp family chaperone for outer membrane proteins